MARNKYPEVTVEKILDVSQRLFLEKGYDKTTIQDIVDELGGLSKGAIYHHFKSKEDILNALGDRLFARNNPFEEVKKRTDLSGLEKMKLAILPGSWQGCWRQTAALCAPAGWSSSRRAGGTAPSRQTIQRSCPSF